MVAPIVAAKAAQGAKNALSGDIWTRTTYREVGKGKDKRLVESTVRANAVTALAAAGAAGVLVVGAGTTLFLVGMKLRPVSKTTYTDYWQYIWPDGTEASASLPISEFSKLKRPERVTGTDDVWKLYTGGFPNPYTVVPEGTEGAVLTTVTTYDYAVATFIETKSTTKAGLDILGRPTLAEGVADAISEAASIPLDLAGDVFKVAPFAISASIQDLKDWLHLP